MCGENSCNVFLLFFMVLWVPIFVPLCKRAMWMMWHAFMFLGFFSPLCFVLGGPHCLVGYFPSCYFLLGAFNCKKSNKKAPLMKNSGKRKTHKPKPAGHKGSLQYVGL
jgi:hypothetical protein